MASCRRRGAPSARGLRPALRDGEQPAGAAGSAGGGHSGGGDPGGRRPGERRADARAARGSARAGPAILETLEKPAPVDRTSVPSAQQTAERMLALYDEAIRARTPRGARSFRRVGTGRGGRRPRGEPQGGVGRGAARCASGRHRVAAPERQRAAAARRRALERRWSRGGVVAGGALGGGGVATGGCAGSCGWLGPTSPSSGTPGLAGPSGKGRDHLPS